MKLSQVQVKTLLFILRDVASKAELDHRFTDGHAADELVKLGLLRTHAGFYSITQQGRELAIAQRKEAAIEKQLKPVAAYVAKVPETISMSKPLDIEALSTPQSGLFKAPLVNEKVTIQKGIPMNAVVEKSRSLRVLEYLEAHPKSAAGTVAEALEFLNPMAYIKTNIKLGQVVFENEGTKRVYSIAPGLRAAEIHRGGESASKPAAEDSTLIENKDDALKIPSQNAEFEIPAFLRKTVAIEPNPKANEVAVNTADGLEFKLLTSAQDTFEQAQAETRKDIEKLQRRVKFAYTDDHTMLIMEHDKLPLELDAESTKRLLDFANEISMVAVV
jgi:hypothetical protein